MKVEIDSKKLASDFKEVAGKDNLTCFAEYEEKICGTNACSITSFCKCFTKNSKKID